MALTENRISIMNIVSKVYRDLQLEGEFNDYDIIEWAVEGYRLIGAFQQYKTEYECINICDYKAQIPCNLVSLLEVEYNGYQLKKGVSNRLPSYNYRGQITTYAYNEEKYHNLPFVLGKLYNFENQDTSFIMENGWFKTSFKEGQLNIVYNKIETDEHGIPLIPDDESYRLALTWYISMKVFFARSIKEDRFRWHYKEAEEKWQWYCGQSGAKAMSPDIFVLENIKRNFLSMLPKVNSFKEFYQNLNDI